MKRILLASLLTAVAFGAVGCAKLKLPSLPRLWGTKAPAPTDVAVDPAEVPPWTPYPSDAVLGEDWDIVVTKARGELVLTNRAPRSFRNVQVWLNRQYVAEAKLIRIGSGNRIPLHRFVNEHGESFPIAGILTPDKGFPLLSCVLFDPATGARHRLLARR